MSASLVSSKTQQKGSATGPKGTNLKSAQIKPDNDTASAFASRINQHWTKAATSILETAVACAQASTKLSAIEKERLWELLPFSKSTFSKLATIGADERLAKESIRSLLPPSFSTIYELRRLNDDQFTAALSQGVLKPDLTRSELQKWRQHSTNRKPESEKPKVDDREVCDLYCLIALAPLAGEEHTAVMNKLADMADGHGMKAVHESGVLSSQLNALIRPRALGPGTSHK